MDDAPCCLCKGSTAAGWAAWSPSGGITCLDPGCLHRAADQKGWKVYSRTDQQPAPPAKAPARPRRATTPRRLPTSAKRALQFAAATTTEPATVEVIRRLQEETTVPWRGGWSCDRCGNRFPSRVIPVDRDGEQVCRGCL